MQETQPAQPTVSLYSRLTAVGMGPWSQPYGGEADSFEVQRYHDNSLVDGIHRGKEVKDVIETFHGVLCRLIDPQHPRLLEAEEEAKDVGIEHIGKTDMHPIIVGFMERLQRAYQETFGTNGRVLLGVTGSGINSQAYKLARAFTRGGTPIFLEGSYHGNDVFGVSNVDAPGWHGEFSPGVEGVHPKNHVPHGDPNKTLQHLAMLSGMAQATGGRPTLFFEDIQGVGGSFKNPGDEYLTRAMEIIAAYNGVAINDNVQSGMRRGHYLSAGKWLQEPAQIPPMIITLAKAIANGAPLAGALVPEEIYEDLCRNPKLYGKHWDTFDANVRTSALGNAVFDIYHDEKLGERTPAVREAVVEQIRDMADSRPDVVKEIRGDGLMIGVALQNEAQVAKALVDAPAFGVKVGRGADALRIAPLADIPLELAEEAGKRIARLLDSLPRAA